MDAIRIRQRALRYGRTVAWLCGLFVAAPLYAAPPPAFFDYLYIEASSGSSAGGHAAVRFGDEVYHFQYDDPGIISAALQPWEVFDLDYRGLENRPIHVRRVTVAPAAHTRLRDAFHQRYLVQNTQVARLASARRDTELLRCLDRGKASDDCGVKLDGAGYFFGAAKRSRRDSGSHPAIEQLREEIERVYGEQALARRLREVQSQIEGLRPQQRPPDVLQEGRVAASAPGFADAYADLLLEWLALRVIRGEALPIPAAFRKCPGRLTARERQALAARESYQRRVSLELLTSTRADRGYPLMISLARQVALRASRERGELFVVDTYAEDESQVSIAALADHSDILENTLRERQAEMRATRTAALTAPASDELVWSRFEIIANVALELEGALAGKPLRRHQNELAPLRRAELRAGWPTPRLDPEVAAIELQHAVERQATITRRLRELYGYDLIRRNCVTEIFRTFDAVDGMATDLGGHVGMGVTANFIPFVSAEAVSDAYRVEDQVVLPSYRELALRRLLASSDRWTTLLREETSLTATLVPLDPTDEMFLFYSTDTVALRPLAGVANLIFGFGSLVAGVVAAPIDGATLLRAGARGVFYSAPELVFMNIRKGSVPLLPSKWDGDRQDRPGAAALESLSP